MGELISSSNIPAGSRSSDMEMDMERESCSSSRALPNSFSAADSISLSIRTASPPRRSLICRRGMLESWADAKSTEESMMLFMRDDILMGFF